MAAPIIIDIAPAPGDRVELATILVDACSRAAGGDGCALGDRGRAGLPAKALAVVWFDGPNDRHLRIDVAVLGSADGAIQTREIDFRDEDLLPDRYQAAGLAVAALAASATSPPAAPVPGPAEKAPSEPRPSPPQPEDPTPGLLRRPGWALGAGALAGGGLEGGPARAGGWAMVSVSAPSGFLGSVSASYSTAVTPPAPGLSVQWITIAAGGGLYAPLPPLRALVRARVEVFLDWALVTASDPGPGASETGSVFDLGAGSALELVWPADTAVSFVGGGSALLRAHGTTIQVHGHPEATLPMGGFLGTVGLEVRLR